MYQFHQSLYCPLYEQVEGSGYQESIGHNKVQTYYSIPVGIGVNGDNRYDNRACNCMADLAIVQPAVFKISKPINAI
jgi:hypothetical protein